MRLVSEVSSAVHLLSKQEARPSSFRMLIMIPYFS